MYMDCVHIVTVCNIKIYLDCKKDMYFYILNGKRKYAFELRTIISDIQLSH